MSHIRARSGPHVSQMESDGPPSMREMCLEVSPLPYSSHSHVMAQQDGLFQRGSKVGDENAEKLCSG